MINLFKASAFVILGASMALAGCDDKPSGTAGSASAGGSAKPPAAGGGSSDMVKAYTDYAKDTCACKDATCIGEVGKKFGDWTAKNAAKQTTAPTEADSKAIADATTKVTECTTKITMAAVTGAVGAASGSAGAAGNPKCEAAVMNKAKVKNPGVDPKTLGSVEFDKRDCAAGKWSDKMIDCITAAKTKDDLDKCK